MARETGPIQKFPHHTGTIILRPHGQRLRRCRYGPGSPLPGKQNQVPERIECGPWPLIEDGKTD